MADLEGQELSMEGERVRAFQKHRRLNSDYKALDLLSLSDPNAQTRAFSITIPELDKITYKYDKVPLEFKLRIAVHIFCKKEGGKQRGILGNTFTSVGLALEETSKYTFKLAEKPIPTIYFHTNTNPNDQIFAIFNLFIREMAAQDILIKTQELGIAEVELSKEGVSQLVVRQTIFNQYLSSPASITSCPDFGAKFIVDIQPSPEFEKAKHLVPMLYLVDGQHQIAGLEVDPSKGIPHLPPVNQPIKLKQSFSIFVEQVQIRIPESYEQDVLKCAQQYLLQVQPSAASSGQGAGPYKNVNISAINLVCCYHNTRTCVNTAGAGNKLVLRDSGREEQEEDDQKKYWYKNLKFEGSQEIDSVFASENAMVIFQLEYQVILEGPQSRISQDYVIGFLPVFVSDKFGIADVKLQDTLMIGGSKSIDNKLMMKFPSKLPVYLVAKINLSQASGGLSPRESAAAEKATRRQLQQSRISFDVSPNQSDVRVPAQPEVNAPSRQQIEAEEKSQTLLKQSAQLQAIKKEVEEKELQLANQNRQGGQVQRGLNQRQPNQPSQQQLPLASTVEMQEVIMSYEKRVDELQKTILQLKSENESSKQQTSKELSEIKDLLGEMRRPHTTYNTFTDPFASGRAQNEVVITNEDDKKRWEILETLTTVPKMKSNYKNMRAFTQQPAAGAEIIQNADKVFLINKGVKGLLDDTRQVSDDSMIDDGDLAAEYNDKFQASVFSVKIVAFKAQISNFEEFDSLKKDSLFSENYYIPERMHFTFNFFQFDEEKTEPFSYEDAGQVAAMKRILTDNKPIVLETLSYLSSKIGPQQKTYNFKIDPTLFYSSVHAHFVQYLFRKSLNIDIWDSDNLMLYGSVTVPLRSLLRQGRPTVEKQLSIPIIDSNFSRERGKLFLILSNQGFEPQVQEVYDPQITEKFQKSFGQSGFRYSQTQSAFGQQSNISQQSQLKQSMGANFKKKVVSDQPITLDEVTAASISSLNKRGLDYFNSDPEQRQKERIRRFKLKSMQKEKGAGEDSDAIRVVSKQDEQMKKIVEIQIIKEEKKGDHIKQIMSNLLTSQIQYDVLFGKIEYIQHEVKNSQATPEIYSIRIDDPDLKIIGYPELQPITLPEEWRFLIEKHGTEGPTDGNFFSTDETGKVTFILPPGQKIALLFKFLTFREVDPLVTQETNMEEFTRSKPKEYFTKYINPRSIDIHIIGQNSRNDNQGFKLLVKPHRQVIDHIFRFYERENKQVQLILPALYSNIQAPTERPTLFSTNPNIQYEWLGDNEVSLQLRVPQVGRITRFNVLAYKDTFYHDLLANWEIEVHSLEGLDIKIDMGQSKQANLTMNSDSTRLVRFFSSIPLSAWFNEPFDRPYPISQGKVNQIGLTLRSFSLSKQRVQVNCVDQNTKELLYSWIVRIDTEKPVVSKMYDLKIPVNKESHIQKFSYQNRTANESSFTMESSQIDILQVVDSRVFLSPGEKTLIKIRIPRREQPGIGEVFLFITDDNEKVECILFKLHFIINK